jgi:hypothetical protein
MIFSIPASLGTPAAWVMQEQGLEGGPYSCFPRLLFFAMQTVREKSGNSSSSIIEATQKG